MKSINGASIEIKLDKLLELYILPISQMLAYAKDTTGQTLKIPYHQNIYLIKIKVFAV